MSRPRPTPADREALRRLSIRLAADAVAALAARHAERPQQAPRGHGRPGKDRGRQARR